jgi:hypothetical protein
LTVDIISRITNRPNLTPATKTTTLRKKLSAMPVFPFLSRGKENGSLNHFTHSSNNNSSNDLKIGTPTNFKHNIQVRYDKEKNTFTGMPDEWKDLLEKNNIRFDIADKEAAYEAIQLYQKTVNVKNKQKSMKFIKSYSKQESDFWGSDERIDLSGDELDNIPSSPSFGNGTPSSFSTFYKQSSGSQSSFQQAAVNTPNSPISTKTKQNSSNNQLDEINIDSINLNNESTSGYIEPSTPKFPSPATNSPIKKNASSISKPLPPMPILAPPSVPPPPPPMPPPPPTGAPPIPPHLTKPNAAVHNLPPTPASPQIQHQFKQNPVAQHANDYNKLKLEQIKRKKNNNNKMIEAEARKILGMQQKLSLFVKIKKISCK